MDTCGTNVLSELELASSPSLGFELSAAASFMKGSERKLVFVSRLISKTRVAFSSAVSNSFLKNVHFF